MNPIRTLRPGDTVQYRVITRVLEPGQIVTRAEVTSMRQQHTTFPEQRHSRPRSKDCRTNRRMLLWRVTTIRHEILIDLRGQNKIVFT